MKRYTLLLTARDTGAALQMGEIARRARQHPLFNIELYAAQPAYHILANMGLNVVEVNAPVVDKPYGDDSRILLDAADKILKQTKPDAVLTGLSGAGAGIDEAIIMRATDIPCYTFQDYWGDVNHTFEKIADCYFTLDEIASELTQKRFDTHTCTVGSPKHASFNNYNVEKLRNEMRNKLECEDGCKVIGLFGQPIQPQNDYIDVIKQFAGSVNKLNSSKKVVYRPHPNDNLETINTILDIFSYNNLYPTILDTADINQVICGCDFVCSAFSSCNLDNIYLNYFSETPIGVSTYLFLNTSIEHIHISQSGLNHPPPVNYGYAVKCNNEDNLLALFHEDTDKLNQHWHKIKETLPSPERAAGTIVSKISRDLTKGS